MRNIELKARVGNLGRAEETCKTLGAVFQTDIRQVDTYFVVASGRLKLRENDPGKCELIHYHRADEASSKASDYKIVPGSAELREMLAAALGVRYVVRKVRGLWLWENVRIHLDTVEGLGTFIEFEAVLGEGFDDADGYRKLARLREAFGIEYGDLIEGSYVDLMAGMSAGF